jgi:hypothetical protein
MVYTDVACTTAGNIWQLAATATSIYGTGFDYDAGGADMNWYGQIILSSASTVDWGVVAPGLYFEDTGSDQPIGAVITIISNGSYNLKAKSGAIWSGSNYTAILDVNELFSNTAQYFALKADDDTTLDGAVLLDTSGVNILDTAGSITGEGGVECEYATLWLRLADVFYSDIYSGTITFIVSAA